MRPFLCIFIMLLLVNCNKSDSVVTQPASNLIIPKYISIKYYGAAGGLVMQTGYKPLRDSIKDADFAVEITDTVYNYCPNFCSRTYRSILTSKVDPLTGVVSSIVSKFIYARQVGTFADGTQVITDLDAQLGNFGMHVVSKFLGDASYYSEATFTQYNDALQQHATDTRMVSALTHRLPEQGYYFDVGLGGQGMGTLYWSKPDTLFFSETEGTATFFQPTRYTDFYKIDIPWYTHQPIDFATYARRSKAVCTQFVLQNGDYVGQNFMPGMERSVRYQYSADSTALNTLAAVLSPGTDDFFWYYLADFRKNWNGYFLFGEALEPKDLYDWTAISSTDSVYAFNGNNKIFKQAATMQNILEKDAGGRPVKITHRVSNSPFYKVMEIKY